MQYQSQLLENAVEEFAKLPGVGRKTALRLVLHLLRQEPERALRLGDSVIRLRQEVKYCQKCYNICDSDICSICSDPRRDTSTICVVENIKEVRFTNKLKKHPVCLSTSGEISVEMQKALNQMPSNPGVKAQTILEINANHEIAEKLKKLYETDQELFELSLLDY